MSHSRNRVPLGAVLQQAGLVSANEVKKALLEQEQTNIKIGTILANQGCINSKTADFFAEKWSHAVQDPDKQPIGQYLKQAALLDESQIQEILVEQRQSDRKFGEIAIAKGWIKQITLNFFLRYLVPEDLSQSERQSSSKASNLPLNNSASPKKDSIIATSTLESQPKVHQSFFKIKLKLLNIEHRDSFSEQVLERGFWWTQGQSFLTPKIFQLVSEHKNNLDVVQEPHCVDNLVKEELIDSWHDQEVAEHFQNIEKRLINNDKCEGHNLLNLYQQVLTDIIPVDESLEQKELIKTGLVVKQEDQLTIANPIYQSVFNQTWVVRELGRLDSLDSSAITLVPTNLLKTSSANPIYQSEIRSSKLRNSLVLLALIALLSALFGGMARRISIRSTFNQGNELLKQKSFERAINKYNNLLHTDSNYFQAWTNRGYALAGLERYEEMRESCSAATIIEPNAVYAWNCLGEALHNLKREEAAIVAFDKAISLDATDPIFLINKSESLKLLGEEEKSLMVTEEAIKVLEKVEAIEGRNNVRGEFAVALTFLGNGYRKKQQYAMAVDSYNRALEYSANYFPAQIGKGLVLISSKRYREARIEFDSILNDSQLSESKRAQTLFYLGKTLCESAQSPDGIAAFEKALILNPNYEAAKVAKLRCG